MDDTLIEFQNVTKCFDNRTILDDVNLKIYDGHVTTIIGKSGTGKSVLLKHIIGLLSPTEGTILFQGNPIDQMCRKDLDKFKKQFSYCFQNNALFDSLTVFDNIALPLQQTTSMKKKMIENKVLEKVVQLELSEVVYKYPSELSGGMQKRAALARALITDPKIVLFDEPTTGQDPIRKNAILSMIAQNQKKFGFTTIMISHDIPDIFFISDRILILYDGKIIFQGTPYELDRLDHPMVDEFVKSLEGFEDELTGLYSKKNFMTVYEKDIKSKQPHETVIVTLFTLSDLDEISDAFGHTKAQEILQVTGVQIDKYFGRVGISTRVGRDQIATILLNTDRQTAERMLQDFAAKLKEEGMGSTLADIQRDPDSDSCFTFSISAGIAEGRVDEDIEKTSEKAASNQKNIALFQC